MPETIANRLKHAWNAFRDKQATQSYQDLGPSYGIRPDRQRFNFGTERSIIASIYTRIGIDVAAVDVHHVRIDQNERYVETIPSGLNDCLSVMANKDQTGRDFMQDVTWSLFDEGCVAIVPVDSTIDPRISGSYDIQSLRVAKIIEWFPDHVRVDLYNDRRGMKEQIILPKKSVAIIENPLYAVMNEPNSTLKRLVHKLNLLDAIDEQSGSGKLDLIIQLPYVIKTPARREQADLRRKDIENQLSGSKYGIAYTDGTEKVTQLNRPSENNLMAQITYLTSMLYSQLGLTEAIFNGTADEKMMINYHNRTIEPVISSIIGAMRPKFLTKTARTQGQSIMYFKDLFSMIPSTELSTMADTFTRNAILTPNEVRAIIGYKPSADPGSDVLSNKNLNPAGATPPPSNPLDPFGTQPSNPDTQGVTNG